MNRSWRKGTHMSGERRRRSDRESRDERPSPEDPTRAPRRLSAAYYITSSSFPASLSPSAAMAGLISPRPLSYLQHNLSYNPYQRAGTAGYPDAAAVASAAAAGGLHTPDQSSLVPFVADGSPAAAALTMHEEQKIYSLVVDLLDPAARESALLELSKKREQFDELALVLWHSFGPCCVSSSLFPLCPNDCCAFSNTSVSLAGIMPALLQEIVSVYPLLSPPNLTAHVSNRVCNALALLQCVASHTDTRQLFLNGQLPNHKPTSLYRSSR